MGWLTAGSIPEPIWPLVGSQLRSLTAWTPTETGTALETAPYLIPPGWETPPRTSDSSALGPGDQPPPRESIRTAALITPLWWAIMRLTRPPNMWWPIAEPSPLWVVTHSGRLA